MRFLNVKLSILRNFKSKRYLSNISKQPWKVLFFGTDDFSLYSLQELCNEYKKGHLLSNLEVVTSMKAKANPVQKFAERNKLHLHSWPTSVSPEQYDVGLVVSFGHLIPETIINKFQYGMLNVHASLLPRWRGAAPIIYALASGDKQTGVSVMRIKPKQFDVGDIVTQASIQIRDDMNMPELHEILGKLGAEKLLETLHNLPESLRNSKPQSQDGVTLAQKVNQDFAHIQWNQTSREIYNLERSIKGFLTPCTSWNDIPVKLYDIKECECDIQNDDIKPGFVLYDKHDKVIKVLCAKRSWICVKEVGILGKKVMKAVDFNNGFIKKENIANRYFK